MRQAKTARGMSGSAPFLPLCLLPERPWQRSGEDQKGRRWKANGSGEERKGGSRVVVLVEGDKTVVPGAPSLVSYTTGTLPNILQFPSADEK